MVEPAPDPRLARLFPALGQAGLADRLVAAAARLALPPGQSICREGAICTHLPLVLAGSARVYKIGESGREITLYRIGPGESCVLTAACILSGRHFPALAAAETAVEVVAVPAQRVLDWLATSSEWRAYVFGLVAQRLADVIGVVEDVAFRRLDQRLADHMLLASGGLANLAATHQQIADDIGTSREVVSRVLKDLEQRGLVALERGRVRLLDATRLAALAAGR
jgi:CRP/FNR family transcriptional regulator